MDGFIQLRRAAVVLVCLTASAGCQVCSSLLCPPAPPPNAPAIPAKVSVTGAVVRPGDKPLPSPLPTLKRLLALAGGIVSTKDVNNQDVEMLVRFRRGDEEIFINVTAIDDTECGAILAKSGDSFEVVPWTKTDLFRGLKDGVVPMSLAPPKDTGNMQAVFNWYTEYTKNVSAKSQALFRSAETNYDKALALRSIERPVGLAMPPNNPEALVVWGKKFIEACIKKVTGIRVAQDSFVADVEALKTIYALPSGSRNVSIEVINEAGRKQLEKVETQVTIREGKVTAPRLVDFRDDSGLGVLAVASLARTVGTANQVYLLSIGQYDPKKDDAYSPIGYLLNNAYLFDGDKFTLSLPQDVPIVKASLIAAEFRKRTIK